MGQKVNPVGFRLGTSRDHDSVWFAKSKDYSKLVLEDIKVEIECVRYCQMHQ
jgi:small subunit ribosomal protein S3